MSGRLAAAGVPPTWENRRAFRELLITAPGLRAGITGVILDAEGMDQRSSAGPPLAGGDRRGRPDDRGPGQHRTGTRCPAPAARRSPRAWTGSPRGWRGGPGAARCSRPGGPCCGSGPGTPSPVAVRANAQALGRYAAACQAAGLVPVVAPHLDAGGLHPAARYSPAQSETVMSLVLLAVMSELSDYEVDPAAVILKPTMTRPGRRSGRRASAGESAEATVRTLARCSAHAGRGGLRGRQPASRAGDRDPGRDAVSAAYLAADVRVRPRPDRAGSRAPGAAGRAGGRRASGRWRTGSP